MLNTLAAKIISMLLLILLMPLSQAAKYEQIEVKNGGNINGTVKFEGEDPPAEIFKVTKDAEVCGSDNHEIDFVKVHNGMLSDVIVYLDKVKKGKKFVQIEGKVDQKSCVFDPYIQIMTNNTLFEAKNSDPVLHNVHTYELMGRGKKTVLNISQPKQNLITKRKIKLRRGAAMKLECDAHDFMHGFIFVARNPYYSLVDQQGRFSIENIPPGKYQLKAWHPTLGTKKNKIVVKSGETINMDFTYIAK